MIMSCFTSICLPVPKKKVIPSTGNMGKTVQQQETTVVEEVGATVFPSTTDETYPKTQDMEPAAVQTTVILVSDVSIEEPYANIQVTAEPTATETTAIEPTATETTAIETSAIETSASVIPNK